MARPTYLEINTKALCHNLYRVLELAPGAAVIAMVKANGYGSGAEIIAGALSGKVAAFGVACLEEASQLRAAGIVDPIIIFQGVFQSSEWAEVQALNVGVVVHHLEQVRSLLSKPLRCPVAIWLKINTGMHRLGIRLAEAPAVMAELQACPWVAKPLGIMSHFASADEPMNVSNTEQFSSFTSIPITRDACLRSMANSAAIISMPDSHFDVVRPGIMLYGVSPFADKTGTELGLKPVMRFYSAVSAIHDCPVGGKIGYGGTWVATRPTRYAIVAAGYGDGYPRHIFSAAQVAIAGSRAPIIGRVSMDMLAIDISDLSNTVELGTAVELWGEALPVEELAKYAGTIAYELLCQVSPRVKRMAV